MIRNNSTIQADSRGVSPVVGVILMVAIVVIISAAVGFAIMFVGLTLVNSFVELTPYVPHIIGLFLLGQVVTMYLERRNQQAVTLADCIEFDEETYPINDEDIEEDEIHIVNVSVETPDNTAIVNPLTVAPTHDNPRNWSLPTRLNTDGDVRFITNTEFIPSDLDSDDTLIVPNKKHGKLNGQYEVDEVDSLTVYDTHLDEVVTYEIGEENTDEKVTK